MLWEERKWNMWPLEIFVERNSVGNSVRRFLTAFRVRQCEKTFDSLLSCHGGCQHMNWCILLQAKRKDCPCQAARHLMMISLQTCNGLGWYTECFMKSKIFDYVTNKQPFFFIVTIFLYWIYEQETTVVLSFLMLTALLAINNGLTVATFLRWVKHQQLTTVLLL